MPRRPVVGYGVFTHSREHGQCDRCDVLDKYIRIVVRCNWWATAV